MGWEAFPSSHIALSPVSSEEKSSGARYLHAEDLPELCRLDERWLRGQLEQRQISDSNILVALIPDAKTIRWHHAREEFAGKELLGRDPSFKGAYAKTEAGEQVWRIWTRTFGSNEAGNTLNILRFVIEGDQVLRSDGERPGSRDASQRGRIRAGAAVLRAAQLEAARWKMNDVQLWNPTPMTILAAQEIEPSSQLIHREEESIASLRWHGMNPQDRENLEWVGNEKYGWC